MARKQHRRSLLAATSVLVTGVATRSRAEGPAVRIDFDDLTIKSL